MIKTSSCLISQHHLSISASSPFSSLNCRLSWLLFSTETGSLDMKVHVNAGEANRKEIRLAEGKKRSEKGFLKWFSMLVGSSFLTFQFLQTIHCLGVVLSLVVYGGESAAPR